MRRLTALGALVAASLLAASCSAGSGSGSSPATNTVTISNESGAPGPVTSARSTAPTSPLSVGFVYEPLVFVNALQSGKATPMAGHLMDLGGGQQVADVHHPQERQVQQRRPADARRRGLHVQPAEEVPGPGPQLGLVGAVQRHPDRVRPGGHARSRPPAVPYFYYIADQIGIVPEHIWSKVRTRYLPGHQPGRHRPVQGEPGTPQNITLHRQPALLAAGEPKVATVNYPAFPCNTPANHHLANGQAQWGRSTSRASRRSMPPRARTIITGSRRRSTTRCCRT